MTQPGDQMEGACGEYDLTGDNGVKKQVIKEGQGETCPSNVTVYGL
jgi:hypothetical protein